MKKLSVLIICWLLVGVTRTFAEPPQKPIWKLGTEISRITYKEPGLMEEEGTMVGVVASYASYPYPSHKTLMLKIEGRYSFGEVDYDGAYWDGTPVSIKGIKDCMWEFRILGSGNIKVLETFTVTQYVGLGYRYLNDDSSPFAGGYERESNYFYSPIGIEAALLPENGISLRMTLEFDCFWRGKQISHLSDADPKYNDIGNEQDEGSGYRASLRLGKEDMGIEVFIRRWNISDSELEVITDYGTPVAYGWEPKNHSTEVGVSLTVRF